MVSVNSLNFDESIINGWHMADYNKGGRGWMENPDPQQTSAIITIDYNPPEQQLPVELITDNLALVREDRKQKSNNQNSCLVEHDVVSNASLKMVRAIEKKAMSPHGMAYQGSIMLLEEATGFHIQLWFFELGVTGLRDSMVLTEFMGQGTFDPTLEDWGGWMIDPYGFGKQTPLMQNLSEDTKYDTQFPDHPLSRLRVCLSRMIDSLTFDPSIAYAGPPEVSKGSWFRNLFGKK